LPLVVARLDSLISSYLGTTAKNIRMLFEFAQRTPCVLFLDESDAMSSDSLLLAATNHDCLLDSAVWQRFDYKLKIELSDIGSIIK
jgi:AAA+ superfamily predicted ATPase